MLAHMLRPKWIAGFLIALAIAAAFAWLGRWQLESAIRSAEHASAPPLGATTLGEAATPQEGLLDVSIGRTVSFEAVLDPRDVDVVHNRLQGDETGYWVIAHAYVTNDGVRASDGTPRAEHAPGLAVAIGWAPTLDEANAAADRVRASLGDAATAAPVPYSGRLEYGQTPVEPDRDGDPAQLNEMAPAYLVNRWAEAGPENYGSYVILDLADADRAGLAAIEVRTADIGSGLNMLNVFYAIEWVVFAFFTIYVWWRLVSAEYEREQEVAAAAVRVDDETARQIRLERLRELRDERMRDEGASAPAGRTPADS